MGAGVQRLDIPRAVPAGPASNQGGGLLHRGRWVVAVTPACGMPWRVVTDGAVNRAGVGVAVVVVVVMVVVVVVGGRVQPGAVVAVAAMHGTAKKRNGVTNILALSCTCHDISKGATSIARLFVPG